MSVKPDPTGMRHAIRLALLAAFAKGSHGLVPDVLGTIDIGDGYFPTTAKVQVAQVRKELLTELGIDPGKVKGKLTNAQKTEIERQLGFRRNQRRIAELQADAEQVYRDAA